MDNKKRKALKVAKQMLLKIEECKRETTIIFLKDNNLTGQSGEKKN